MIQPLRTVHRRTFATLALLLPAIVLAGLSSRHQAVPPAASAKQQTSSTELIRSSSRMWRTRAIRTEFYACSNVPEKLFVALKPARELSEPDLLLYWSAGGPSGDSVPADARLLGAFSPGKALALPAEAAQGGRLTLYSLGHQSVVDTAPMEKLP